MLSMCSAFPGLCCINWRRRGSPLLILPIKQQYRRAC
jgi:hypothetical protein